MPCVITKSISNWKKFLLLYITSKYPKFLNWPFLSPIKFISKLLRWISLFLCLFPLDIQNIHFFKTESLRWFKNYSHHCDSPADLQETYSVFFESKIGIRMSISPTVFWNSTYFTIIYSGLLIRVVRSYAHASTHT